MINIHAVAGAALLVLMASGGASAAQCFRGNDKVDEHTHSITVQNRCHQPVYWRMCINSTWRGKRRFSGLQQPMTASRFRVVVPRPGDHFTWQYSLTNETVCRAP